MSRVLKYRLRKHRSTDEVYEFIYRMHLRISFNLMESIKLTNVNIHKVYKVL